MRTNIEIDDELMARAMRLSGLATKRAAVEEALRLLVRIREQAEAARSLKGLGWEARPRRDAQAMDDGGAIVILVFLRARKRHRDEYP